MTAFASRSIKKIEICAPCDVCGKQASFYSTEYYVHICSEKCYKSLLKSIDEELNNLSFTKLKGTR